MNLKSDQLEILFIALFSHLVLVLIVSSSALSLYVNHLKEHQHEA